MFFTDPVKNGNLSVTQDIVNNLVEKGRVYIVQSVIENIPAGHLVDIFFDLSKVTSDKLFLIESVYYISSGSATAKFYLPGSSAAGGTPFIAYNRNENSPNTPEAEVSYKTDEVETNIGAALPTAYQLGATGVPASAGSGARGDDFLTDVKKSLSRVLRFTHSGTAPFNLDIRLIFAEIP